MYMYMYMTHKVNIPTLKFCAMYVSLSLCLCVCMSVFWCLLHSSAYMYVYSRYRCVYKHSAPFLYVVHCTSEEDSQALLNTQVQFSYSRLTKIMLTWTCVCCLIAFLELQCTCVAPLSTFRSLLRPIPLLLILHCALVHV